MSCPRKQLNTFFASQQIPGTQSEYPDCFYCPVTHKLFEKPIILSTGITVDISALRKIKKICPITKKILEDVFQVNGRNTFYVTNITLKNIIDEYENKLQQLKAFQSQADAKNEFKETLNIPESDFKNMSCPISLEEFTDPVVNSSGVSIDRYEMEEWLSRYETLRKTKPKAIFICPYSGIPLAPNPNGLFVSNITLKQAIGQIKTAWDKHLDDSLSSRAWTMLEKEPEQKQNKKNRFYCC